MSERIEVKKQLSEQESKFAYYIIALCVTAIGFSIYNTTGKALKLDHSVLGLAIISWGLSIYFGFNFIQIIIRTLKISNTYLHMIEDSEYYLKIDAYTKSKMTDMHYSQVKEVQKHAQNTFKLQQLLFYIGIITYLAWHVIQMSTIKEIMFYNKATIFHKEQTKDSPVKRNFVNTQYKISDYSTKVLNTKTTPKFKAGNNYIVITLH